MNTMRLLTWWIIAGVALPLAAAPVDDLASPSQARRDVAAKIRRAAYDPAPPANLKAVLARFHLGMSQDGVLWRLRAFHPQRTISISSGTTRTENYELGGGWLLHCAFGRKDENPWMESTSILPGFAFQHDDGSDELFSYGLYQELGPVWVEPPTGFTGRWVTYYLNGQKSSVRRYARGKLIKERKYDEDGSPAGSHGKSSSDDPLLTLGS